MMLNTFLRLAQPYGAGDIDLVSFDNFYTTIKTNASHTDSFGYTYVLGETEYQSFIAKLTPSGVIEWSKSFFPKVYVEFTIVNDVIYVWAKSSLISSTFEYASYLALDSSGNLLWSKNIKSNVSSVSFSAESIAVTNDGLYSYLISYIEYIGYEAITVSKIQNSNQSLLWSKNYHKQYRITSIGSCKCDQNGNLIINCLSNGLTSLLKISTDGSIVWSKQFGSGSIIDDSLAVDTDGSIYVGNLAKVSSDGNLLWSYNYANISDVYGIVLTNEHVTYSVLQNSRISTLACDKQTGALIKLREYFSNHGDTPATTTVFDDRQHVFCALASKFSLLKAPLSGSRIGRYRINFSDKDLLISAGNVSNYALFARTFTTAPASNEDSSQAVLDSTAILHVGNTYTGSSITTGYALSSSGFGRSIYYDGTNIYMSPSSNSANAQGSLIKYTQSTDAIVWQKYFATGTGCSLIAVDGSGTNIYVFCTGYSGADGYNMLVKYTDSGVFTYHKSINIGGKNTVSNGFVTANAVYMVIDGYYNTLVKMTHAGAISWSRRIQINGVGDYLHDVHSSCIDASENVILVNGTGSGYVFIVKYTSSGSLSWSKVYRLSHPVDGYAYFFTATSSACDPSGNIYIVGNAYASNLKPRYTLILKLNSSGVLQWSKTHMYDSKSRLFVHTDGTIHVVYDSVYTILNSSGDVLSRRLCKFSTNSNVIRTSTFVQTSTYKYSIAEFDQLPQFPSVTTAEFTLELDTGNTHPSISFSSPTLTLDATKTATERTDNFYMNKVPRYVGTTRYSEKLA
jgi:hypothetical protein